jgi:hypothetical protein
MADRCDRCIRPGVYTLDRIRYCEDHYNEIKKALK